MSVCTHTAGSSEGPTVSEKLQNLHLEPKAQNLQKSEASLAHIDISLPSGEEEAVLSRISPLFTIQKTVYGGRGCFASEDISEGTELLHVNEPIGSSVVRPFRKEVCTLCFAYHDGRTLKHRIDGKLYFCSQKCQDTFAENDVTGLLIDTLCRVEELYLKCEGEIDDAEVPKNQEELERVLNSRWAQVDEWESRVFSMKASKRAKFYPVVTPEDYAEIKYVITSLFTLSQHYTSSEVSTAIGDLNMDLEVKAFQVLQSSEAEKVSRYPYLMVSYINIYKFVRLVAPEILLPFVTPTNIRGIIGRNLTNAFGIWSSTTQEGEEREFFGFGVYPSGSFFNHSCDFNVNKTRDGASYTFVAKRDILKGEELCISYGINGDETVEQRRESLREWFFICGCKKCKSESGEA